MAAGNRRHVLIVEPDARGHTREWLEHIAAALAADAGAPRVTVAAPPALTAGLSPLANSPLSADELEGALSERLVRSAQARWRLARRHARAVGADHVHFLELDHLTLPLGLGRRIAGCTVSGVLFRPSAHYGTLGAYAPTLAERLRDARKAALYAGMLLNGGVHRVLSLDPTFPPWASRWLPRGDKAAFAPDPVMAPITPTVAERELAALLPPGRLALVLFGVLTERKGVLPLLDGLARLEPGLARRLAVVLAGRIDPAIAAAVRDRVARLPADLWWRVEDRTLSAGELAALVQRSDAVLAPYQRFVGSSGVLLWAARCGKPVLAQDFGLVGYLVRRHGLGMAAAMHDGNAVATALDRFAAAASVADPAALRAFASQHQPAAFARAVLDAWDLTRRDVPDDAKEGGRKAAARTLAR